jgi:hypothetical protein
MAQAYMRMAISQHMTGKNLKRILPAGMMMAMMLSTIMIVPHWPGFQVSGRIGPGHGDEMIPA